MNLLEAYLTNAWAIAILHLLFFLICVGLWVHERRRLLLERKAFRALPLENLKQYAFPESSADLNLRKKNEEAEILKAARLAVSMVQKGELASQETLRLRLLRSLARHESIVRTCLNGFIVSGLIGTLYNLWQLGPSFWEGLIQGQNQTSYPSIGIAFSASVFGLGYALSLSFADSLLVRRPREEFVREAATELYDSVAKLLPPSEGAGVAEALQQFQHEATGFLREFKDRHEEISRQFTEQVQTSSDELVRTLNNVSGSWESLTTKATDRIHSLGGTLEAGVKDLTDTTTKTGRVLGDATARLHEAQQLNSSLSETRTKVETLLAEIGLRLSNFNDQWQRDLNSISQSHVVRLEEASVIGWKRYEEEADKWHQKNVSALEGFAGGLQDSISEWNAERQQVAGLVEALIEGWRRALGQNLTTMQAGLGQLHDQIINLQQVSTQLVNTNNSNVQQLNTLQNSVANISRNLVNGTPIGAAIDNMTGAVEELKGFLRTYSPPITGGGPPQDQDLSPLIGLLRRILSEIETLPGKVAAATGPTEGYQAGHDNSPPKGAVTPGGDGGQSGSGNRPGPGGLIFSNPPPRRSIWKRIFKRKAN